MKVLITGATGLVGQAVVRHCLSQGIHVNYLTTRSSKIKDDIQYRGFLWSVDAGSIDKSCFDGVDVIVHLAGATVSKRWTPRYKKEIEDSRIKSTELLINSLKTVNHQVRQVVTASGVNIYPDSLTAYYEEDCKEVDNSFLGKLVYRWERAVDGFSKLNISITKMRIGMVLSAHGGALPEMAAPIKLGMGATFGKGTQWQSWIHIDDLAGIILFLAEERLQGVYNAIAPNPVTNRDFTKTLATVMKRPLFLPGIPKTIMKLVLGEMHELLYSSQRVSSKKIEAAGYIFKYHSLNMALKAEYGE